MSAGNATCALCGLTVPVEEIVEHLRDEHELEAEPATWPDGEVVIVDQSLEPEDFA